MSSHLTENSILGDQIIFEELICKAYTKKETADAMKLLRKMVKDGVIQVDALVEKAISVIGKVKRSSGKGKDFIDGSDAKKATTSQIIEYPSTYNGLTKNYVRRVARITNLRSKKGWLRCVVAETLTNEIFYFKIPYSYYKDLTSIAIYFNEDGSPKRNGAIWEWSCNTFTEMSK